MKTSARILFPFLFFCTALTAQTPRLVIPIGHTGDIAQMAISPDEKYILTGSADQTAILWNRAGKELFTFRGHGATVAAVGFLYAGAEKYALTGDQNGTIKVWDLNGAEKFSFSETPGFRHGDNWVRQIAFSPDGKRVRIEAHQFSACKDVLTAADAPLFDLPERHTPPAGLVLDGPWAASKNFIVSSEGKSAALRDKTGKKILLLQGHASPVVAVRFSPNDGGSRILTSNANGYACVWDLANGNIQPGFGSAAGNLLGAPAFAPDGTGVLGHFGETVQLLDWKGARLRSFCGQAPVVFSPDGKTLLTRFEKGVKTWDVSSGKALQYIETEGPDAWLGIQAAAFSPAVAAGATGGQFLATTGEKIQVWDRQNPQTPVRVFELKRDAPSSLGGLGGIGSVHVLAFTPDGRAVLAPLESVEEVALLDVASGAATDRFVGHHEAVTALAVTPVGASGMRLLTGSKDNTAKLWDPANNTVKSYSAMARQYGDPIGFDLVGGEIQTFAGHANDVLAVDFSPAGPEGPRFVLTGSQDNTAKIWDANTGKELATLIALGATDWVVSSPSGLFDASPGAMQQLYYMIGLDVVDLEQLKERYYEPGLLGKITGFAKGEIRDISTLGALALYPELEAELDVDQLRIQLTKRSGGMGKLSFFINGKEVAEDLNPGRQARLTVDLNAYEKFYLPGPNTLALRAYNSADWLKSPAHTLEYTPPASGRGTGTSTPNAQAIDPAKPQLYAIVVGTSDYSGAQLDLRFPDLDAAAMAQALGSAGKALFAERVHLRLLTTAAKTPDDIASKKNIAAAFSDFAAAARPTDILICYFSGHGLNYGSAEKSQFYYLTKDIASPDLKDEDVRKNYTVSSEDLTRWLTAIPAKKQVMILDACNSGKAVESLAAIGARELNAAQIRALDRMKDRTGMFILTGSAADKVSYEASQYGQGLLTYSLLQGMSGLALTADKRVDVMTLFQYARDRVPELAKSIRQVQVPVLAFPASGGSFDIGIVDAGVKIPLAQVKPVFIRNVFQDEDSFDDVLGLTNALAAYFQEITARGAQAELIYVDVSEYENAYSIKGRYSVSGDAVTVRGRLFQGKTSKGEFTVTGKKTELPALVEALVEKVSGML
ncbi:MAG: caspase family protein [Saprospiraceae bacterium]|nr:caspase family protein [Saprospiraceae bacterium]